MLCIMHIQGNSPLPWIFSVVDPTQPCFRLSIGDVISDRSASDSEAESPLPSASAERNASVAIAWPSTESCGSTQGRGE